MTERPEHNAECHACVGVPCIIGGIHGVMVMEIAAGHALRRHDYCVSRFCNQSKSNSSTKSVAESALVSVLVTCRKIDDTFLFLQIAQVGTLIGFIY